MFSEKKVNLLICSYCKSVLKIVKIDRRKTNGILKCKCDEYPVVSGIIYLRKTNRINKAIVDLIKKEKLVKALVALLSFSLSSKVFFTLTSRYPFVYKLLGYKNF